jgi:hypothetical protein
MDSIRSDDSGLTLVTEPSWTATSKWDMTSSLQFPQTNQFLTLHTEHQPPPLPDKVITQLDSHERI